MWHLLRRAALSTIVCSFAACGSSNDEPARPDASRPADAALVVPDARATDVAAIDAAAQNDAAAASDGASPIADPTAAVKVDPIAWTPCNPGAECAKVKVPLDYARPDGEKLELLVARIKATDPGQRIGSLFSNPGGPGAGGVTGGFLAFVASGLSDEIRAHFDIVSWDPRGVAGSQGVDCMAMPDVSTINGKYDHAAGTSDRDALIAAYALYVSQCKANAAALLPHVGTSDTVSDLELLRRAVGDDKLNYLGFSYGTAIGEHYYLRYPDRVRALVLDGVEPIWTEDLQDADQDRSFDGALSAFLDWCGRASQADCPFARAQPDRGKAFDDLEATLAAKPVPAGNNGETLTIALFKWGIGNYLYTESSWPSLGTALEGARTGNGAALRRAAVSYLGTGSDQDPFFAINCADAPVATTVADVEAYAAVVAKLRVSLPYASLACVGWPVMNMSPPPATPAGPLPPIVLVGTVGDPATPYRWAMATKAHLGPSATLLTAEGYTHTAYERGLPCIDDPVNAFLIKGTIPGANIRCPVDEPSALRSHALRRPPWVPPRRLLRRR